MKPLIIALTALGFVACSMRGGHAKHSDWAAIPRHDEVTTSNFETGNDHGEAYEAGIKVGVDYPKLIRQAGAKDKAALRRCIQICASPAFDGAALEVHFRTIRQLLVWWGDEPFACAIAPLTPEEGKTLQWAFSDRHALFQRFPVTANLVFPHK